jgi:hypothetical protein
MRAACNTWMRRCTVSIASSIILTRSARFRSKIVPLGSRCTLLCRVQLGSHSPVSSSVALVRRCVRQLIYFRCVKLVDIFQYSNVSTVTPRLVELAENETLRRHCQRFVWTGAGELPSGTKLFQLYAALQHGLELKDFCLLHDTSAYNVDEKKLVTFGVLHGLIRRVHRFPVLGPGISRAQLAAAATAAPAGAAPPATAGTPPTSAGASGGATVGASAPAASGAGTGSAQQRLQ